MAISSNQFSIRIQPKAAPSVLPAWVPTPGQIKSIHTNDLVSVNACPSNACWYTESSGQNGPWANWCGSVLASDYSEFGAMVFWGGGHGGYDGTEFYIFDLTTQKWSRLNDPIPHDFLPEIGADWCDTMYNGQPMVPASHTYSHVVYIPAAAGGGPKGSWCLPYNVYGSTVAGVPTAGYRPHSVDLATGKWARLTNNTYSPDYVFGSYGGCFIDAKRKVLWGMAGTEGSQAAKIDLTQNVRTIVGVNDVWAPTLYFVPVNVPEKDMMVACAIYGDGRKIISLSGYDLSSGTPVGFSVKFAVPQIATGGAGIGMDWCPDTGKFYLYEGFGTTVVYVATPPASGDWKNGTWTWSTETMKGESPANLLEVQPSAQGAQPFTKWKYNPKLKCFMWSQGTVSRMSPDGTMRNGAFQLYRPLGT
jgi:hypothetical protein